jgi:sugar phosphate isomerase/epimerase
VEELEPAEAEQAARAIVQRGLEVNTLSTAIFYGDIEQGEAAFRTKFNDDIARTLETAPILNTTNVRLLSAKSSKRATFSNCADYIAEQHPWVIPVYREAIDRFHNAGFQVVIENEVRDSIFSHPQEVLDFFAALDRPGRVHLTWDITNLWEEGTYPSLDVYRQLKPLIALVHVKGGREETPGGPLRWASRLEDATWPVLDIVDAVVRDGVSPVICLNPSHGARTATSAASFDDFYQNILFLRTHIEGIE